MVPPVLQAPVRPMGQLESIPPTLLDGVENRESLPATFVRSPQRAATMDDAGISDDEVGVPATLQRGVTLRSRLRWRIHAAAMSDLITDAQRKDLEASIQPGHEAFDEVANILDGLGVGPAPPKPLCSGSGSPLFPGSTVRIFGLEALTELNDVQGICQEWLQARGRWSVRIPTGELKALKPGNLTTDLEELGVTDVCEHSIFRCPNPLCDRTRALDPREPRQRFECSCGAPSCCTCCREQPYHYHCKCEEVPSLRARWSDWLQGKGRTVYRRLRRKAVHQAAAQKRALLEASRSQHDVEATDTQSNGPPTGKAMLVKGEGVRHLFTQCAFCRSQGKCIVGPRFRCLAGVSIVQASMCV